MMKPPREIKFKLYPKFNFAFFLLFRLICVVSLAFVAAFAQTAPKNAAQTADENVEKLMHPGDVLEVDVLGSVEFDWRGALDDAGFLTELKEINEPIAALCRSEDDIARDIAAAYSKILRKPEVVVRTLDRSGRERAALLGAIRTQQRFQIERPVRLNELIVLSGGITDRASGEITIFRPANVACAAAAQVTAQNSSLRIKIADLIGGKFDANPLVRAGDVVTIEEAAPVYVTGGVIAPQRILFRSGLTLARAVASAGGLSREADNGKIIVYRRRKDSADLQIIESSYNQIVKKNGADVSLEPFDIIEVAQTGRRAENRAPIVNALDSAAANTAQLPLRIIN